jgi:3-oxoacyl-[acyl-carrier protein] reductase
MTGRVHGKVIIVTGANSGIGRATALRLAEEGAKLGLLDVNSPVPVAEGIISTGGEATAVQCDVRDAGQVEQAVKMICAKYGPLDGKQEG